MLKEDGDGGERRWGCGGKKAVVSVGHRSQEPAIVLGSLKKHLVLLPARSLQKLSAEGMH